jgi:hypothetical protein
MSVATGRTIGAISVMLIIAVFQILEGIRAVRVGGTFVDPAGFAYHANNTAFGWLHIALGAFVALAAFALATGRVLARGLAVLAVTLSAVASFFWLPFLPVFALVIIALDIFVIWAATTGGSQRMMMREAEEQAAMGTGYGGGNAQTGERWPAENVAGGRNWDAENRQAEREHQAQAQERANAEARSGRPRNDMPPSGGGNPPPRGDNG